MWRPLPLAPILLLLMASRIEPLVDPPPVPLPAGISQDAVVHAIVLRFGGSISAEHGIGQLKRDELAEVRAPIEMELMRRIKLAFDPAGIMNPDKVLRAGS